MGKKDFERKLDEVFNFKLSDQKSVAVDPRIKVNGVDNIRKEPFSLVFIGSNELHLTENSYWISVEGYPKQIIFMSVFKRDIEEIHYDSIFNK